MCETATVPSHTDRSSGRSLPVWRKTVRADGTTVRLGKGVNRHHLLVGEGEVKDRDVFGSSGLANRLGQGDDTILLHQPSQYHLGNRSIVRGRNLLENWTEKTIPSAMP